MKLKAPQNHCCKQQGWATDGRPEGAGTSFHKGGQQTGDLQEPVEQGNDLTTVEGYPSSAAQSEPKQPTSSSK
ncbi:hypothetical protein BDR26DRAFT_930615 [Obelidium mucronatum]|nr:hypothetical protein BDR26DRAFT_930615 [Obelidium mucronatum]